jgi:hypothetical protein
MIVVHILQYDAGETIKCYMGIRCCWPVFDEYTFDLVEVSNASLCYAISNAAMD